MEIAERLAAYMRRHELSQAKVAQIIGVQQGTVSKWLAGSEPRLVHYQKILDLINGKEAVA